MKAKNRKQRKEQWINAKNLMRQYPDCAYDGQFYCNHMYDPDRGWQWVDFRFFHTKLKKYFAVAANTAQYAVEEMVEEIIDAKLNELHPYPAGSGLIFHPIDKKTGFGRLEFTDEHTAAYNARELLKQQLLPEVTREAQKVSPKVDVKDYGKVAVGLWVTLDVPKITPEVIVDFIKFYQSLGEPITPGRAWTGKEVEIVPERYSNA
jgi:hypothetical protein